jgi:hypothetical protein
MSFVYTPEKERHALSSHPSFAEASSDIRAMLCMTNTTADTDQDAATLSAITTLDEYSGSGYARASLAAQTITRDDANNRAELSATSPISFGSTVAAAIRSAAGILLYRHIDGTAANDQPIAWIDTGGFPVNGAGGPFTWTPNAEGILQWT